MPTSLNEVYKAIGELTSEVAALRREITSDRDAVLRKDEKADESRANVHRRLDSVAAEVAGLKNDMVAVRKDVSDTKAVTDQVRQWKLMGMGALGVTGLAASAVTALVAAYWQKIVAVFTG